MDFGNILVVSFAIMCIVAIFAFWGENADKLFAEKSATRFVFLNQIVLLCGVGAYAALYYWNIFWLWKCLLAVVVFDVIITFILFIRVYVSDHYYDSLDIQDGILKKVNGSQYLRILKLPKDCVKIENDAFADLPELEEIYFGKNVESISDELLEHHHLIHTLHFKNSNTTYSDALKEKYTIKQKIK